MWRLSGLNFYINQLTIYLVQLQELYIYVKAGPFLFLYFGRNIYTQNCKQGEPDLKIFESTYLTI